RQGGGRSRESDVRGSSTLPFGLPIARLTTSGPPRDGGIGTVGWPIPAAPPGRRPRLGLSLTGVNGQPRAESTGAVGADGLAGAHAPFGAGKGLPRPRRSTQFRPS